MSDRGSILISTANDIGEALVEKLGGEGYAPSVWDKEYNKLGIAEVDSAPALSVLEDSSETGTARGSILLSTANAIGAVLNKKYNTDRGFKPKEWASAASKLAPLPQKSAESASICSIEDGADDVPIRSLVVTIPPTLTGVSEIIENHTVRDYLVNATIVQGGFNINNGNNYASATRLRTDNYIPITSGSYTIENIQGYEYVVYVYDETDVFIDAESIKSWQTYGTAFTVSGNRHIRIGWRKPDNSTITSDEISGYHCYKVGTKTTYTADLGRTIYGGQADIVNGEVNPLNILLPYNADSEEITVNGIKRSYSLDNQEFTFNGTNTKTDSSWLIFSINASDFVLNGLKTGVTYRFSHNLTADMYAQFTYNKSGGGIGAMGYLRGNAGQNASVSFTLPSDFSSLKQFQIGVSSTAADIDITAHFQIEIGSSASAYSPYFDPFTFDGQEIPTKAGYNAFWSDQGNTALDYYGVPEPYTRGTASGAIANVQSARTDLPFTMVKANIAPNLTGVESVEVTKAGKNIYPAVLTQDGANRVILYDNIYLPAGNYYISLVNSAGVANFYIKKHSATSWTNVGGYNKVAVAITISEADYYDISYYISTGISADSLSSLQLEVGSSGTEYTPYEEPTVYTADLGDPVYGGYADLVSGTGLKICGKITFNGSENWSAYATGNGYAIPLTGMERGTWYTSPLALSYPLPKVPNNDNLGVRIGVNNDGIYVVQANTIEGVTDLTSFKAWLAENPLTIIYPLDVTTEFTFDAQVISPSEGVNNLWNNAGGDTDVEYFEQE